MSEGLEKLRAIGAQKIHEQTHISHKYVQALLHENFDGMQKVQLLGFISILEREYEVDLTSLRHSAIEHFEMSSIQTEEEPEYKKELLASSSSDRKKLYIAAVLVLLVLAAAMYFSLQSKEDDKASPSANTEEVKSKRVVAEQNVSTEAHESKKQAVSAVSDENNDTSTLSKEQTKKQQQAERHTFVIFPRTKVWLGIIDLDSGKKRQTVTSKSVELNASKNYLLSFGHGYIDIDLDGNKTSLKDPKSVKFLYKDGELKKIDNSEFRSYNKGKLW